MSFSYEIRTNPPRRVDEWIFGSVNFSNIFKTTSLFRSHKENYGTENLAIG